jgi:hypothetical protein
MFLSEDKRSIHPKKFSPRKRAKKVKGGRKNPSSIKRIVIKPN